jgi:hypothetical protein
VSFSGCVATPILDWQNLSALVAEVGGLREAHEMIRARVRPVYSLDEGQAASVTVAKGRGSCSQRLAVLEAVSRARGIATRSRGLVVDGRFWYPRFPRLERWVPEEVVLAWPEFFVGEEWVPVSGLFDDLGGTGFTNDGTETLFEAISRTTVDWDGLTCGSSCDLSRWVRADLGIFSSRDDLFASAGQTICGPARLLLEPVMGRWSAGVQAAG